MGSSGGNLARRARFEGLYGAHGRAILAFALRRAEQPADAADVLAEVFLVAWRRLDDVPDGDDGRLWLYGVARWVLANHRRSGLRRRRLGDRLAATLVEQWVPDPASSVGDAGTLRAALDGLSSDDREVLQLSGWEGLSSSQVAAVLDVPASTVRTRLHRARRRLATELGESAGEHIGGGGQGHGDGPSLVRDHEDRT